MPFVCLILKAKKNMLPKIELDSWKEWVRNSALQMTTCCQNLELGEIRRIKVHADTTLNSFLGRID